MSDLDVVVILKSENWVGNVNAGFLVNTSCRSFTQRTYCSWKLPNMVSNFQKFSRTLSQLHSLQMKKSSVQRTTSSCHKILTGAFIVAVLTRVQCAHSSTFASNLMFFLHFITVLVEKVSHQHNFNPLALSFLAKWFTGKMVEIDVGGEELEGVSKTSETSTTKLNVTGRNPTERFKTVVYNACMRCKTLIDENASPRRQLYNYRGVSSETLVYSVSGWNIATTVSNNLINPLFSESSVLFSTMIMRWTLECWERL